MMDKNQIFIIWAIFWVAVWIIVWSAMAVLFINGSA